MKVLNLNGEFQTERLHIGQWSDEQLFAERRQNFLSVVVEILTPDVTAQ